MVRVLSFLKDLLGFERLKNFNKFQSSAYHVPQKNQTIQKRN